MTMRRTDDFPFRSHKEVKMRAMKKCDRFNKRRNIEERKREREQKSVNNLSRPASLAPVRKNNVKTIGRMEKKKE